MRTVALRRLAAVPLLPLVVVLAHATDATSTHVPPARRSLQERIARGLAARSPVTRADSAWARDEAARKLSHFDELAKALPDGILWGGFDPKKGYDPKPYSLTELYAPVWVKLYLSTFMFPGTHRVHREGDLDVLEMDAKFRGDLDPGDYPYPFWHSPAKWKSYVGTQAVLLVFKGDQVIATYRKADPDVAAGVKVPEWSGKWQWTDAQGSAQPRVALFSFLFSPENPRVGKLDAAYRDLEGALRAQTCTSCHSPDNKSKAQPLLLLGFPNQALAARHTLVDVLEDSEMPPEDEKSGTAAGIHDEAVRNDLIQHAKAFERAADDAIDFEHAHGGLRPTPAR